MGDEPFTTRLGRYSDVVEERLKLWQKERFFNRLFERDPTLWFSAPLPEITNRLGWLNLPETSSKGLDRFNAFSREVKAMGISHVVLLGMGGSSLAPQVFMHTFKNLRGYPELIALDSTHPIAVKTVESEIELKDTLFIVSSKSGTTLETLSLFRYFWKRAVDTVDSPNRHFVAITDPDTPLERLAKERDFLKVFLAPPDVGGRFSALSVFGLLPAALIGIEIHLLLEKALPLKERGFISAEGEGEALRLGAILGELAMKGRDKVTFLTSPSLHAFPDWLEQLIAESTGKDGKGIVPVVGEPIGEPLVYGDDRLFICLYLEGEDRFGIPEGLKALEEAGHPVVGIKLTDKSELGREIFRWEVATASAGAILGIHPFNQPDVEVAKRLAREVMEGGIGIEANYPYSFSIEREEELKGAINAIFKGVKRGDYIGLQAYLPPTEEITALLKKVCISLRNHLRVAVTLGFGPRYLHSTGQLHKGGPNSGIFLQLVDEPEEDLPIPETDYTFKTLIQAQALGDYKALRDKGRRVIRINLGRDVDAGLKRLVEVIGEIC